VSDNPCGHDQKFGLMLLPKEDNGCLACAFEHSIAREKDLRAELAAAKERIANFSEWIERHCLIDWIATHNSTEPATLSEIDAAMKKPT
jgi:hypothetical protein